ncbi:uncharacterized protein KD926_002205 [Aspergillus affinis]|uniref:uncharacterized protein n=1 Tax=Aspergillus affinis TaxID=1070780 RepID=UPI0022FEA692|nr:uncharacterized protein KD926_002205 [Aspergillus affinis]KAI9036175.1 hypothetical protein KD926_002205 [Aspergillus affinis]
MNCIIRVYLNKPYKETPKADRDAIHNILKQDRQLWAVAGTNGMGTVLTCDDLLMSNIKNNTIYNTGINAVARYAIYTRPAIVNLLHSLTPVLTSLMFGQIHTGLAVAIHPSGSGVLGSSALSDTFKKDEATLTYQEMTENWQLIDLKRRTSRKKAEVLANESKTKPVDPIHGFDTFAAFPLERNHPDDGDMVTSPFDDTPLAENIENPTWESFLNNEDLDLFCMDNLQFGKQS